MRKLALFGASALVLGLGVAGASAEPFNPATDSPGFMTGPSNGYYSRMNEGRAAAVDGTAPFFGIPTPFSGPNVGYAGSSAPGSVVLQQFHEGK